VIGRSSIEISPSEGGVKPATIIRVVVLPEPLGPRSVRNSPRSTTRSIASTAVALE
jgi:hypothetical protein